MCCRGLGCLLTLCAHFSHAHVLSIMMLCENITTRERWDYRRTCTLCHSVTVCVCVPMHMRVNVRLCALQWAVVHYAVCVASCKASVITTQSPSSSCASSVFPYLGPMGAPIAYSVPQGLQEYWSSSRNTDHHRPSAHDPLLIDTRECKGSKCLYFS